MAVLNHSLLKNGILEPDMVTEDEVSPGCNYNIILNSRGRKGRIYCSYNYTVPECEHCDNTNEFISCDQFEPFPEILSVEPITENKFLIKWNYEETPINPGSNITLSFEYIQASSNSTKQAVLIRNDLQGHTSEIVMDLLDEENYTLIGTFEYDLSCLSKQNFDFIAPRRSNYVVTIIIFTLAVLTTILVAWKYKNVLKYNKKLLKLQENTGRSNQHSQDLVCVQTGKIPMKTNLQYHSLGYKEGFSDEYEFPSSKIIVKEIIGSGAFGQVYSAKAIGIGGTKGYRMVAVKTVGDAVTKEATNDLIAEIEIFKKIGHHPNIVALLGCCTMDTPYMMIMEFVPCGDLKKYLLELRGQWLKKKDIAANRQVFFPNSDGTYVSSSSSTPPDSITPDQLIPNPESMARAFDNPLTPLLEHYTHALDKVLDHTELQKFAVHIARGMAHLEKIGVTHRDLAARNILINEFKTLKISDFGLSRSGPYINHKTKKLPLRWMAVEAIVQQKYDSKSDVWSFGVVLWEIGTLGAFPYESVPDSFIQQFLQLGRRLERPEICTDELYSLMERCWSAEPEQRPSFHELVEALDVKKRKVYVDFDRLSPGYVFPPSG